MARLSGRHYQRLTYGGKTWRHITCNGDSLDRLLRMGSEAVQIRRPVSFGPEMIKHADYTVPDPEKYVVLPHPEGAIVASREHFEQDLTGPMRHIECRLGKVGEGLWVRENFQLAKWCGDESRKGDAWLEEWADTKVPESLPEGYEVFYKHQGTDEVVYRTPYNMPFWASRLRYVVESIDIHRLHDTTPAQMRQEGFVNASDEAMLEEYRRAWGFEETDRRLSEQHEGSLWADNPYVWAVTLVPFSE